MRTNEERIERLHARVEELNQQKRTRHVRVLQSVCAAACFAAVILLAVCMPQIAPAQVDPAAGSPGDMHASMFAAGGALGYVMIAVVAFLLGIAVTVFCFRLKRWQKEKEQEEDL